MADSNFDSEDDFQIVSGSAKVISLKLILKT